MGYGIDMGYGFSAGIGIFGAIVWVLVIAGFAFVLIRLVVSWVRNSRSPVQTMPATVVTKRMEIHHHRHANAGDASGAHGFHTTTSSAYYVTFQVSGGERLELSVKGTEYGLMAEGDRGMLTWQGTRFRGFER